MRRCWAGGALLLLLPLSSSKLKRLQRRPSARGVLLLLLFAVTQDSTGSKARVLQANTPVLWQMRPVSRSCACTRLHCGGLAVCA